MGSIIKIAFRNLVRHSRRTILTALTIGIGLMSFIIMDSIMLGADRGSVESMVYYTEGALKIHTSAYNDEKKAMPLDYGIINYSDISGFLMKQKDIAGVTRRAVFLSELSVPDKTVRIGGTIIDPQTDPSVFRISNSVKWGRFFGKDNREEIVLGKKLADDLGLKVGDQIIVAASTRYGAHNALGFNIVGLVETMNPSIKTENLQAYEFFIQYHLNCADLFDKIRIVKRLWPFDGNIYLSNQIGKFQKSICRVVGYK